MPLRLLTDSQELEYTYVGAMQRTHGSYKGVADFSKFLLSTVRSLTTDYVGVNNISK